MNETYLYNNSLEVKKYRLSTISPVHIRGGDGGEYYGQGYIRKPGDNKFIYLIDTLKLQKYLFDNHGGFEAVNSFNDWLENDRSLKQGITSFLDEAGFDFNKTLKVSKGRVHIQKEGGTNFIRNGMNRAYIPGSSIKGVIRTAVLWKILEDIRKNNPAKFDKKLLDYIKKAMKQFKTQGRQNSFKQDFAKTLTKDIFQNFLLKSSRMDTKHKVEINSPFTDLFKAVKVKDTQVIDDEYILTKQWGLLSLKRNQPYMKNIGRNNNVQIYESGNQNRSSGSTCFEIILDQELLENFKNSKNESSWGNYTIPFDNIDGLMKIVFDFSKSIWNELSSFYKPYYQKTPATKAKAKAKTIKTKKCMVGKVKFIKQEKGAKTFGFIEVPGSDDVFFHISKVRESDQNDIKKNDTVKIDGVINTPKGLSAKSVYVDNTIIIKEPPLNINSLCDFYSNSSFNNANMMKIGWGTGLLGTTIAMFLKNNENLQLERDGNLRHIMQILRDEVIHQQIVNKGRHVPKSARVICNLKNEPEYPLGWVRLD